MKKNGAKIRVLDPRGQPIGIFGRRLDPDSVPWAIHDPEKQPRDTAEDLATDLQDKNIGVSVLFPGPTMGNLGQSSFENRPAHLRNEGETWPPQPPPPGRDVRPRRPIEEVRMVFMNPVETGERVVRGIRNNDLFIHTHPEFRGGYIARHDAIIRAIPNEPRNEKRFEIISSFGTIYHNEIYDKQQPVGPPDWT
jgi:hypothetical protein